MVRPRSRCRKFRVNTILPGGTDTPMGRTVANTPEAQAFVEGLHALKRMAAPEEIARSVLHLASEASRSMTGATLLVDGGVEAADIQRQHNEWRRL